LSFIIQQPRTIKLDSTLADQPPKFDLTLGVLTELQNRGVKDILIACVDGLKGFPEAINAALPETRIQLCIVHMVRNSVK
jgi:transposase-like protein